MKKYLFTFCFIILPFFIFATKYTPIDTTQLQINGGQAITSIETDTGLTSSTATDAQIPTYKSIITNVENLISALSGLYQSVITGAATTITDSDLTINRAVISNGSGKIAVSGTTDTELGYVSGVTSAIQDQINGKQATITGAASTIAADNLTAARVVLSNSLGKIDVSEITDTELGYLKDVTSNIQDQLGGKQTTITGAASTVTDTDLTANTVVISNASGKLESSSVTTTELEYLTDVESNIQDQIDAIPYANNIATDTSGFSGNLSSADTTVQLALETIDDMNVITTTDTADTTAVLSYSNADGAYKLVKVTGASANDVLTYNADGTISWSEPPGASGGEANTASNVGTVGTGVFKQKSGTDLELYKLNSESSQLDISLNGTDRIDFTLSTGDDADSIVTRSANNTIATDSITEITGDHGVEIDGVTLKDAVLYTDTITEDTTDSGVTIDGLNILDGGLNTTAINIGDGTDTDIYIYANNGDENKPAIRYNSATNKWQFSNDGVTFTDMGSGTGGGDMDEGIIYSLGGR